MDERRGKRRPDERPDRRNVKPDTAAGIQDAVIRNSDAGKKWK